MDYIKFRTHYVIKDKTPYFRETDHYESCWFNTLEEAENNKLEIEKDPYYLHAVKKDPYNKSYISCCGIWIEKLQVPDFDEVVKDYISKY
jgi:hypothetical protein